MVLALVLDLLHLIILANGVIFCPHALQAAFARTLRIDGEHGDELFQLRAFTGGAGGRGRILQDQGFEALFAVEAFVIVDGH